jgi:hypothetical protein
MNLSTVCKPADDFSFFKYSADSFFIKYIAQITLTINFKLLEINSFIKIIVFIPYPY